MKHLLLLLLLIFGLQACKKTKETSPIPTPFKDYVDSLNYIIVDSVTYYHMITDRNTHSYSYKDMLGYPKWYNNAPYNECFVNMVYGPLQKIDFFVITDSKDTINGSYSKIMDDEILYGHKNGKAVFTYDSLKIYTNPKDSSEVIYISGQSSNSVLIK